MPNSLSPYRDHQSRGKLFVDDARLTPGCPCPARRSKPTMRRLLGSLTLLASAVLLAPAADPAPPPRARTPAVDAPAPSGKPKMPLTGLAPAQPMFDACLYR